jgi:hypothetical protein
LNQQIIQDGVESRRVTGAKSFPVVSQIFLTVYEARNVFHVSPPEVIAENTLPVQVVAVLPAHQGAVREALII